MGVNMKNLFCLILVAICFSGLATAQAPRVQLKFEVDGKPKTQMFKVTFVTKESTFEAKNIDDGFVVPNEILDCDSFGVKFVSKKYSFYFQPVFRKDLDAVWTVGIDNKPFEKDNISSDESYDKVSRLKFLRIRPLNEGIASILVVREK